MGFFSGLIGGLFGGGGGDGGAGALRQQEEERQKRVKDGTANINSIFSASFTPKFYADAAQRNRDYLMPQLDRQATQANQQSQFGLARQGLNNSSVAAQEAQRLAEELARGRIQVESQAQNSANDLKSKIEAARADLIQQLSATGDSASAVNAANARAASMTIQQPTSALGQVFDSGTRLLGYNEIARAAGRPGLGFSLFGNYGR